MKYIIDQINAEFVKPFVILTQAPAATVATDIFKLAAQASTDWRNRSGQVVGRRAVIDRLTRAIEEARSSL